MRITLIHALSHSVEPINHAFARDWPEATRMNLLDDSLSVDLAGAGALDAVMHRRFHALTDYAISTGADAILFTSSAFGPCIEDAARQHPGFPILKPYEGMIDAAVRSGMRTGLIASYGPTLRSMVAEFPPGAVPELEFAEGALEALHQLNGAAHDDAVVAAARRLQARGCEMILLAQFSMARAARAVRDALRLPVLSSPESAVAATRARLMR